VNRKPVVSLEQRARNGSIHLTPWASDGAYSAIMRLSFINVRRAASVGGGARRLWAFLSNQADGISTRIDQRQATRSPDHPEQNIDFYAVESWADGKD
jgi:hypothetical protein